MPVQESYEREVVLASLTSGHDLWPTNSRCPGEVLGFGVHVTQAVQKIQDKIELFNVSCREKCREKLAGSVHKGEGAIERHVIMTSQKPDESMK